MYSIRYQLVLYGVVFEEERKAKGIDLSWYCKTGATCTNQEEEKEEEVLKVYRNKASFH